jgi:hypothetical protein
MAARGRWNCAAEGIARGGKSLLFEHFEHVISRETVHAQPLGYIGIVNGASVLPAKLHELVQKRFLARRKFRSWLHISCSAAVVPKNQNIPSIVHAFPSFVK